MDSKKYANLISRHYECIWDVSGIQYRWTSGPWTDLPDNFSVLLFPPNPRRAMWTYATRCMSDSEDFHPIELHMFSPMEQPAHVELLTALAHYHRTESSLELGDSVNFGRPWIPESLCDYGLISYPYLDGIGLEKLDANGKEVNFYWLIPITKQEVEFKKKSGVNALEIKFERRKIDYLDPFRKSCV